MTTPFNLAKLNLHVTMMKSILVTFLKGSVGGFSHYHSTKIFSTRSRFLNPPAIANVTKVIGENWQLIVTVKI